MQFEYWEYDNHLIELLLESKMTTKQMAKEINVSEAFIIRRIKLLGLEWILHQPRKMSRGQTALTQTLKKILPNELIVNEYHIGERLKLDIYCPGYKLAIEYHGRQHFDYVAHFHESYEDFVRAKERDERKIELCKENDIALVAFRYCDDLSEEIVYNRILAAIKDSAEEYQNKKVTLKPKRSMKDNPHYQEVKAKRNAHQRDLRRKIKQENRENEKARAQKIKEQKHLDKDNDDEWSPGV